MWRVKGSRHTPIHNAEIIMCIFLFMYEIITNQFIYVTWLCKKGLLDSILYKETMMREI